MAAKLSLAQQVGTLHLSLRNDQDEELAETRPVTLNELRFLEDGLAEQSGSTEDLAGQGRVPIAWKSMAKGLVTGVTGAWEATPHGEAEAPAKPAPLLIRTLRANHRGLIQVTQE
jgi:hypothetical protein